MSDRAEHRAILISADGKHVGDVSKNGEVITRIIEYDEVESMELAEPDTAFNFYKPIDRKQFVITSLNGKADMDVSVIMDAELVIYEADSVASLTEDRILWKDSLIRGDRTGLSPLNILVNKGKYVNAKTTDDDIHLTITGYYINEL